ARLKHRRHKLLGHATVSVGVICGGTQANIVPDRCTITIDRRTVPGESEASVTEEIKTLLRSKKLHARVMDTKVASCQPLETNVSLPLVRDFLHRVGQKGPLGVHFFCDAAVLAEAGIPSVVFGPGDVAQAHTANEWVSITSLERARDKLVHFLKSLP
ncbi:MAG TPA: peptidase dimerization domain-containing protein, partial [Verrucomicrobiae bacterium]|nr:peptidase dimerization domain-containing protein [Verrucomicrobiae bacterium]